MSEWPSEPVSLSEAARLFSAMGREVDRTNLGRYITDRNFPFIEGERGAKLIDAEALWKVWSNDYTRQTMAGEDPALDAEQGDLSGAGGDYVAMAPAGVSNTKERSDPKRELAALKLQGEQLDLAERLKLVVPAEEVAAAQAVAISEMEDAMSQAVADVADDLLQALHQPAHMRRTIVEALKGMTRRGREALSKNMAAVLTAQGEPDSAARARLDALVAHDLKLRAAGDAVARQLEPLD